MHQSVHDYFRLGAQPFSWPRRVGKSRLEIFFNFCFEEKEKLNFGAVHTLVQIRLCASFESSPVSVKATGVSPSQKTYNLLTYVRIQTSFLFSFKNKNE